MINFYPKNLKTNLCKNNKIQSNKICRNREAKGDVFVKKSNNVSHIIQVSKPTEDLAYIKNICKDMKIAGITPAKLQSVIGPKEFKDIIAKKTNNRTFYVTGERPKDKEGIPDSNKLENVKMKVFGASLHTHSTNSDGKLTVEEILNQAAEYGDEYEKVSHCPFVIGITDHNTVDGCKEAVKIIASDPEKYKNIRVVLGAEISTKESELNGYKFKKPEKYHLLTLCVNPFDITLNDFLADLQKDSGTPMRVKTISLQEAYDNLSNQQQCYFALAHPAYPDITHRIKDDKNPYDTTRELIKHFKDIAGDRGLYSEAYYSSYYGNLATDSQLYDTIVKACDDYGLYKAGGIDTHGEYIFYNGQNVKHK